MTAIPSTAPLANQTTDHATAHLATPTTSGGRIATGSPTARFTAASLAAGFGAAVCMWVVWWITHLPGATATSPIAFGLILAALALAMWVAGTRVGRTHGWTLGLAAGVVSALVNTLILGSKVVEQVQAVDQLPAAANQFQPGAAGILLGFLAASAVIGAIAGGFGGWMSRRNALPTTRDSLATFGAVAAVAFVPLLAVGGAVTGTESGMAVPDSVTTYGTVSVLFPISLMAEPRIFLEHTHRLFGTLLGLTTLTLFLSTFWLERRIWVRILAGAVFALVGVQGVLGIMRVSINHPHLAMTHGVFAQLVFAVGVVLAAALTATWVTGGDGLLPETRRAARGARTASMIALIALILQLMLGAASRHLSVAPVLWAHVVFSIVVVGAVLATAFLCRTAEGATVAGRLMRRIGLLLLIVVGVQFLLGWASLWKVGTGSQPANIPLSGELAEAQPIRLAEAIITTAHQATGAVLLAMVTLAAVWARRLHGLGIEPQPAQAPTASTTSTADAEIATA